ncbi:type II secretion system protein GspM, partial [Pseudomonas frederiksbergensis]|nr:type II secretion system protein GspM [Pseudomonas frederiksbergensis]
ADYQLKIVVPDMDHYPQLLLGHLTRIEGVTSVRSSFVLNQVLAENHSWQIKGRAADEQGLQRWLLAVQGEGVRPRRWSQEQAESAMTFELELQQ